MSNSYNRNRNYDEDIDIRFETSEKDTLIKKLNSHIYEMEKNEKNFQILNSRFKTLQKEYNNVLDDKLRLEYELREKSEISNQKISDIRRDIENLQLSLNEKIAQNKKMCNDYANLQSILDKKINEVDILRTDIAGLIQENNILKQEKNKADIMIQDLREIKHNSLSDLDRLTHESQKLNKIIREDESIIKSLENERAKLLNYNDELKQEIKELKNTLRNRDDTINYQTNQLGEANLNSNNLEKIIHELELKNSELLNEINDKNFIIQKETRLRNDREKDVDSLNKIIKEKGSEIQKILDDSDFLQNEKQKLYEDNTRMFNEIDRLKKHIYIITDQNQQLCDELDRIQDQDEKIKNHLNRKDRISTIIRNTMNNIEGSLRQIEDGKGTISGFSPLHGSFRGSK